MKRSASMMARFPFIGPSRGLLRVHCSTCRQKGIATMAEQQFIVRDQRRFGWFSIDNEIIDEHGGQIGAYGVAVYNVISRHSRNQVAKLSQRDIAATLGISQDRVRKSLADLVDLHLVHMDVPERAGPGLITTITLLDVKLTERHTFS